MTAYYETENLYQPEILRLRFTPLRMTAFCHPERSAVHGAKLKDLMNRRL